MINPSEINLDTLPWLPMDKTCLFPKTPAIYFAIDSLGVVQYIGRSVNVRSRWSDHHKFEQLNDLGSIKIAYLFLDAPEILPSVEAALIQYFQPCLNRTGRVKEKNIHLRLSVEQYDGLKLYAENEQKTMTQVIEMLLHSLPTLKKKNND